jgi:hypothetical protein
MNNTVKHFGSVEGLAGQLIFEADWDDAIGLSRSREHLLAQLSAESFDHGV